MLTISTRSSPATMSSVPLPWWTSKSTMATRSSPRTSSAWRAATATLLKKQKPIAWSRVAWWPGGRTEQKALRDVAVDDRVGRGDGGAGGAGSRRPRCPATRRCRDRSRAARPSPRRAPASRATRRRSRCCGHARDRPSPPRRLAVLERRVEAGGDEMVVDRIEPAGAFGVAGAHVVAAAVGMCVKRRVIVLWRVRFLVMSRR